MLNELYQSLDPIAFSIGPFTARWYGLAYVAGFLCAKMCIRDSPFLDMTVQMAMHNQIIGMILNYVFAKSPMFLFALLLAVSIVCLLYTSRRSS